MSARQTDRGRTRGVGGRPVVGSILRYGFLLLVAAVVVYPVLFAVNTALRSPASFARDQFGLALPPDLSSLFEIWDRTEAASGLVNSLVISFGAVVVLWIVGGLAAFGLTKLRVPGASVLLLLILGSLIIPFQAIMYPLFQVLRDLDLLNQHLGLILVWGAFNAPVTTFLFASYFRSIPDELIEAARLDGASSMTILRRLMIPLSTPVIATTGVLNFVWSFNDLLLPLIVLSSPDGQPYIVRLALSRGPVSPEPTLESAGVIIGIIPLFVVALVAQRYFVRGVLVGVR